jgi:hypothetical protein
VPVTTQLLLASATTAVLIVVAAWESISLRDSPHGKAVLEDKMPLDAKLKSALLESGSAFQALVRAAGDWESKRRAQ